MILTKDTEKKDDKNDKRDKSDIRDRKRLSVLQLLNKTIVCDTMTRTTESPNSSLLVKGR